MYSKITNLFVNFALPVAIIVTSLIFTALEPAFLSIDNVTSLVHRMAGIGIMAVGMTFVIMTRGIDLSVGPVLALAGLISFYCLQADMPLFLVVFLGLLSGTLVGIINGFAVAFLQLPPIIITLGMLSIVRGSALIIGGPTLHQISNEPSYTFIGTGVVLGIPFPIWLCIFIALLGILLQKYTTYGLQISSLGDNERAAFLSGRRVKLLKMSAYAICGTTAALAGIIESSQVHTASANFGEFGTELDVIAAVILGGASLFGGKGSVSKTLLGVVFLGVINSGLNILNIPVDMQLIAKGVIIVIALALVGHGMRAR